MTRSRITGGVVALAGAGALIAAPAATAVPDLPHLVPLLPTIVSAQQQAPVFVDPLEQPGHVLYRFDSVIKNTGGALDLFSVSPMSTRDQNPVTQAVWAGGVPDAEPQDPNADPTTGHPTATVEPRPGATMVYNPTAGHHHWHFLQAAEYTLLVPGAPSRGSGKVVGFCMHDSYDFNVGAPSYYPEGYSGSIPGDSNRTWCQYFQSPLEGGADPPVVRGGISPGWGDLYESQDAGQWIDVTGLTPGTYTLRNAVNPDGFMKASAPVNGDDVMEEPRTIPGVTVPAIAASIEGGKASAIALSGKVVGPEIPARVSDTGACDDEHLAPTTPLADCYRTAASGGPLTFAVATAPAHGSVSIASGGGITATATYTPAVGYSGPDSFTYTATDARGLSSMPATVSLTVTGPGPAHPVAPGGAGVRPTLLAPRRLRARHRLAVTVSLGRKVCGARVTLFASRFRGAAARGGRGPYRRVASRRLGCASRARLITTRLPAGTWSILARVRVAGREHLSAPRRMHLIWR